MLYHVILYHIILYCIINTYILLILFLMNRCFYITNIYLRTYPGRGAGPRVRTARPPRGRRAGAGRCFMIYNVIYHDLMKYDIFLI